MMARPRAISLRTSSGSIFSRLATKVISSVMTPLRARCICDMFLLPLAAADSASRFSIQLSRNAIEPPSARSQSGRAGRDQTSLLRVKTKYGIGVGWRQPRERGIRKRRREGSRGGKAERLEREGSKKTQLAKGKHARLRKSQKNRRGCEICVHWRDQRRLPLAERCTLTVAFVDPSGTISNIWAFSRNGFKTAGLNHSRSQPSSIAISRYLPGRIPL